MLAESCWSPACIHHSTSLHFPLSSFRIICLLQFLSDQLFKKPSIFHFIFSQCSPILCFGVPPVFFYPQLLSPPYFPPLSPGSSVFAYHLSVIDVQAANRWQWVVFTGQYLLAHKRLITSRQSPVCNCVFMSEAHKEGYTLLIRSNSSHLLLEVTQHTHTAMFPLSSSLSIYTACRWCQSQL